jgi:hypothetical protein
MARRVQSCLDANGGHFQHMLWRRHISHTTEVLLFKFHCNICIGVRIIKEISGSVASGTLCTIRALFYTLHTRSLGFVHNMLCQCLEFKY